MKVKFFMAGTDRMVELTVDTDSLESLIEGDGWVHGTTVSQGWDVMLNMAQVGQIERSSS